MQTYTRETTVDDYRLDILFREAVCRAAGKKKPELLDVADACRIVLAAIDERKVQLRQLEDDLVRAQAVESAEKLELIEAYDMLRRQLAAYEKDKVLDFLPVAPSVASKLALEKLDYRVSQAISNVKTLAPDHPVRRDFLPALEAEFAEFQAADLVEDEVRRNLAALKLALTTYKAELARERDTQLGQIQAVLGDRAKVEYFTRPWRPSSPAKKPEQPAPDA